MIKNTGGSETHHFQNKNMWITSKIFNMIGHIEVSHTYWVELT